MLISFTVNPQRAEELMALLPLVVGRNAAQVIISKDSEEFHTVDVNFEDIADTTTWQAVRLVATAIDLKF